jgi:hypothetical protein
MNPVIGGANPGGIARRHKTRCNRRHELSGGLIYVCDAFLRLPMDLPRCAIAHLRSGANALSRMTTTLSGVIARHRLGAARRPMTGSDGRSRMPEMAVMESKSRGVLDTRVRGV